jgi:hypothetical protein
MASVLSTAGVNSRKFVISQSDAGRELVVKVALSNMTNDNLYAIYQAITLSGGDGTGSDTNGPDAFTVAGFGTADGSAFVSGTTDVVYFRVQGTGTFNTTTAAAGTGATVTVEAIFTPAL